MLTPRPYQQAAHDAVIDHWKKSTAPVVVEATTGAGKSVIVALLAKSLYDLSGGKRVLCLQPTADLVEQNAEKYKLIGERCSIYSASISKSLRHQVIFATEGTFKRVAKRLGHEFAGVIIDEAHRIMPTIQAIIDDMRLSSPNLRVCGLSATPYRLGTGYIYGVDEHDRALHESVCKDPYFYKLVYAIRARELIEAGYLTPLRAGDINTSSYDTDGLKVQSNGSFSNATIKAAFEGWGRKTSAIIADVVAQTQNSRGVMIFAATVKHAEEIMASLHPDNARMVGGKVNTNRKDRKRVIDDFKAQKFTYLVSVGTMTTGIDFTHVDTIAILRATESVSLLQQIMGRGMRLHDGKHDCLVIDYANNLERHCPDGDLYKPEVKAKFKGTGGEPIECLCESCNRINAFSARKNDEGFDIDAYGYFTDLAGERVLVENHKGEKVPLAAHHGRRCNHYDLRSGERCSGRWSSKLCPVCEAENDIAARYCCGCKAELVNPNEKLIELHTQHKKDPTQWQTDEVLDMTFTPSISKAGNQMLVVDVMLSRRQIKFYLLENNSWQAQKKAFWASNTDNFTKPPRTITYRKKDDFWEAGQFNAPTDDEVLNEKLNTK